MQVCTLGLIAILGAIFPAWQTTGSRSGRDRNALAGVAGLAVFSIAIVSLARLYFHRGNQAQARSEERFRFLFEHAPNRGHDGQCHAIASAAWQRARTIT